MESIKKLIRTPSALALIIVALITLIGVLVQTNSSKEIIKLSIDATATAEARQTPIPQTTAVTQIVTQLVEVSQTAAPPSVALLDRFSESRNDGLGLQLTETESLVTTVGGGHYIAQINSDDVWFVSLITPNKIRNFDFSVKVAEIQGDIYLSLRFRENPNVSKIGLDLFASGERKGEYIINDRGQALVHNSVAFVDLSEIRIICINSQCDFFLNGATNPLQSIASMFDPSGQFKLGFSGHGVIRIDEIMIQELQ